MFSKNRRTELPRHNSISRKADEGLKSYLNYSQHLNNAELYIHAAAQGKVLRIVIDDSYLGERVTTSTQS
jgi:hypothetical protein